MPLAVLTDLAMLELSPLVRRDEMAWQELPSYSKKLGAAYVVNRSIRVSNVEAYQIRQLANDDHCWRVDWFGAVTYAERYRRASQPLIEIQFSQVPGEVFDVNELFALKNDQWPKTKQVRLPVGFLPMFKIGDIWHDGRLLKSPGYDLAHFDDLSISRSETSLIKSGLPGIDGGSYYLPTAQHPFHMRHTQSYCVLVKALSCNIIIPSAELIRFYFGSSSTFVSRLFDAPFSEENFWTSTEDCDSRGAPKIHLAPGISGFSASDIGRIAFSKEARSAAELIGNSCIAAAVNGERAYPKAVFPFDGNTDLRASGKWLPFDGNERGVFLVFKLISCTHPFPFASLRYTSERHASPSANALPSNMPNIQRGEPEKRFFKSRQETKSIVDAEPGRAKRTRSLGLLWNGEPFPDLTRKPVSKVEVDQVPTILLSQKGISILSGSSVGDNGRDPQVQPIELAGTDGGKFVLTGKNAAASALTVAVFLNLVGEFLTSGQFISVDIIRLNPRQRLDYLSMMPQMVDDDGELSPACLIESTDRDAEGKISTRHRRISIGRALSVHNSIYFMVPESQATNQLTPDIELHLIVDTSRSVRTHADLLAVIAIHFSGIVQFENPTELGPGVIAMVFTSAHSCDGNCQEQAMVISNRLYENSHFFVKKRP